MLLIASTSLTSAADAGIVDGTLSAMTALYAFLVLGVRPGLLALVRSALASAGVRLVSTGVGRAQVEPLPNCAPGIGLVAEPTISHRPTGHLNARSQFARPVATCWFAL